MWEYYLNKLFVYIDNSKEADIYGYQTRYVDFNILHRGDTVFVKDIFTVRGTLYAYVIINKASEFETTDKVGNIIFLRDLEDDKKFRLVK